MSPELGSTGINANLDKRGDIVLTLPSGEKFTIEVSKKAPPETSENVLTALGVMRLAVPLAFPEETHGVADFEYSVEREGAFSELPGDREEDYRSALKWAGAVLQKEGWKTERVASLLISEYPNIQTGISLGTIGKEHLDALKFRLKNKVSEYYPGAASSIEKKRKKKISKP